MQIYRIGDKRHSLWDGMGAAMLEIRVPANLGRIPATHCHVVAEVPQDLAAERQDASSLPAGWDGDDMSIAQRCGDHGCSRPELRYWLCPRSWPDSTAMRSSTRCTRMHSACWYPGHKKSDGTSACLGKSRDDASACNAYQRPTP
jgi:hypothetical protein